MKLAVNKQTGETSYVIDYEAILTGMQDTAALLQPYDKGQLLKCVTIYLAIWRDMPNALPRLVEQMAKVADEAALLINAETEKGKEQ